LYAVDPQSKRMQQTKMFGERKHSDKARNRNTTVRAINKIFIENGMTFVLRFEPALSKGQATVEI